MSIHRASACPHRRSPAAEDVERRVVVLDELVSPAAQRARCRRRSSAGPRAPWDRGMLRSRASRCVAGASAVARSGRIQIPGPRAARARISAARPGMSGNFSLPRSHVPTPDFACPRSGCQPSSITANGRFGQRARDRRCAARRRARFRRCSCRMPSTNRCDRRQVPPAAADSRTAACRTRGGPRTRTRSLAPCRVTISHTGERRSPSSTPAPPLRTSAHSVMP